MNKLSNNEKGFGAVEAVMVIAIVALIAVVGWLVYKDHHKSTTRNTTNTSSNKAAAKTANSTHALPTGAISKKDITGSYTYPDGYFSVAYPASWSLSPQTAPTSDAQPGILATIVDVTPPNAAQAENAVITAYKGVTPTTAISENYVDGSPKVNTTQNLTINGYKAVYQQDTMSGSNSYVEDNYAVTNGKYTVVFTFRVKQTITQPAEGLTSFNATSLLPEFNAIVSSIKF